MGRLKVCNYNPKRCEKGCKVFECGGVQHHPDCFYYPDSLSMRLDKAEQLLNFQNQMNKFSTNLNRFGKQHEKENENYEYPVEVTGSYGNTLVLCGKCPITKQGIYASKHYSIDWGYIVEYNAIPARTIKKNEANIRT